MFILYLKDNRQNRHPPPPTHFMHSTIATTHFLFRRIGTRPLSYFSHVKAVFKTVDSVKGITASQSNPAVFVNGIDYRFGIYMLSEPVALTVARGTTVCLAGYALLLERIQHGSNETSLQGTCSYCTSGTYSINPLAGPTSQAGPGCFSCPQGGDCKGGSNVHFSLGTWIASDGMFILVSCPAGHQLVNTIGQSRVFSQAAQNCLQCLSTDYILSTSMANISCQACPIGALCDGNSLVGRIPGSVWIGDMGSGLYRLRSCPPGYEVSVVTQDSQQCRSCSAFYFCAGGAAPAVPCPVGLFSPPGSNVSSACRQVIFVEVVVTLSMDPSSFKLVEERFQIALAAASGVLSDNVILISTTTSNSRRGSLFQIKIKQHLSYQGYRFDDMHEERQADRELTLRKDSRQAGFFSSTEIVSHIAAPEQGAASTVASSITPESLSRGLFSQNLPAGRLDSVSILGKSSQNPQNIQATIVGAVFGVAVFFICLAFLWFWFFMRKRLDVEEAALALKMRQLRARFRLTKKDGYIFHSEKRWWDRGLGVIHLRQGHLEALARFALHQEFDLVQFNGMCNFVEEEDFFEQRGAHSSLKSRYQDLCEYILEVSTQLIVPDIPRSIDKFRAPDDISRRYRYFFNMVMKANIWQNDSQLFESLKAAASKFMDEISDLCRVRHEKLRLEASGQELVDFAW